MKTSLLFIVLLSLGTMFSCSEGEATHRGSTAAPDSTARRDSTAADRVVRTDEEWRRLLTEAQFNVTRRKGTEPPFTGEYVDNHDHGVYRCVCCGADLFTSDTKFDSGTGWPSFYAPIARANVREVADGSHGMTRTEVTCSRCDAHLGHVFDDGPAPTGLRYCINSVALTFIPTR